MAVTVTSFCAFLLLFSAIGVYSTTRSRPSTEDYLLAGREVTPWLTALSSVATNNSGFMFIGLLGFTYRFGVQAVWLQLGWVLGDLIVWLWVHRRVRELSGRLRVSSVPELLGTDDSGARVTGIIAPTAALTFFFLAGYAAAQFKAGSTALTAMFGWEPWLGACLGASIVVLYCFSGGLRASIWTDAAQALVMLGSMTVLVLTAACEVGGAAALSAALRAQDPELVRWIPENLSFGFGLYLLGFVFGGLGAIGQPHILVRSMAIRSPKDISRARGIYFAWFVPFNIAAVLAGLYARVLLPDLLAGIDPSAAASAAEHTLPRLAKMLLPQVAVGSVLAGLFSATMSTADSQVLACSAAVTHDLAPRWRESYFASKLATLCVAALALALALTADKGVFDLVLSAWSALGATLGPLLLLRVFRHSVSPALAAVMMVAGLATVFGWENSSHAGDVFKLLPGIIVPLAIYGIVTSLSRVTTSDRRLP
jgi:sodium/proline symporter